jgi:hypothetical protein
LKIHVSDKHVLHNYLSFQKWESAERAASLAGFRSLVGDSEDRMKSRGVNFPKDPEGEGNPRLPFKTSQLYQNLIVFRLEFPLGWVEPIFDSGVGTLAPISMRKFQTRGAFSLTMHDRTT